MFLAVLFMISMCTVTVGAADTTTGTNTETDSGIVREEVEYTYYTASGVVKNQYFMDKNLEWTEPKVFASAAQKLAAMDLRLQKDGYQIYVDEFSGEIACRDMATEEVLFTNPYNIGSSKAAGTLPYELMSQIIVQYKDKSIGTLKTFTSFEEAALRGQIKVKNIKNGIRVEYTIGREEAKMLVPRVINQTRFEERILKVMADSLATEGGRESLKWKKVFGFYLDWDLADAITDDHYDQMIAQMPIVAKMPVYILDESTSAVQMAQIEILIKTYAPSYTYEDLEYDHELTEYEGEETSPPLFKMALEYTINEKGLSVTLPANGLRFDESRYTLENIRVLPYMGAGKTPNPGYTFFPDGSGAIFDFEQLGTKTETQVSGTVYGVDYAYQTITATHQETIRYPVFGLTETQTISSVAPDGSQKVEEIDRGYIAIIEEGDSMAKLTSYHGGNKHEYHSIQMEYYPRPKDSYNLKDAISSTSNGSGAMWEVVSSRKYTGDYSIRYIMLTDEKIAKQVQHDMGDEKFVFYEPSYVGMAHAYRDYLLETGVLTALTEEDVSKDIPLYLNVFGAIDTTEKIMSVPVDVTVPLTSFEDIKTMYKDLAGVGITNLNFKLTGFNNGGMYATAPYHLNWEKAVGGKNGFKDLLKDANEKGYKIFPDFDFVYVTETGLFDGLSLRDHVVKSIDNRYSSRREYSATKQSYVSYFELCLSPAYYDHFYTKLTDNYLKFFEADYETSISVGTLGSELNSDFDEDDPYNREDSKGFTIEAFKFLSEKYDNVMTSGGNAYTWKYVDYILDVPLDSSRFIKAAASVPFMGMVLHGYIQFAGTPINMEGNIDYAFLKAIENGSSINFILSYQNTTTLKEDFRLSKYYSVRYDIWFDDVVEIYKELNSLLSDVQLDTIVDHEFIPGNRVPDLDEIADDLDMEIINSIQAESGALSAQEKDYITTVLNARQTIRKNSENLMKEVATLEGYYDDMIRLTGYSVDEDGNVTFSSTQLNSYLKEFNDAVQAFIKAYNGGSCTQKALGDTARTINDKARALLTFYNQTQANSVNFIADLAYKADLAARQAYENAVVAFDILKNVDGISDYILNLSLSMLEETAAAAARVGVLAPGIYNIAHEAYDYAISGTSDITDKDGKVIGQINTYQFYLFAICGYISVVPTTKLNTEYLLQRYEIGLTKSDLTARGALDQLCNALGMESPSDTPAYKTLFESYLAAAAGHKGYASAYDTFTERYNAYLEVYDRYTSKKATSKELNAALTPLTAAATSLNSEFNYLVGAFVSAPKKANEISALYGDDVRADVLGKANAFSAAFSTYLSAADPSKAELDAMLAAADTLNAIFDTIGDDYVVIAKDSSAGINSYAKDAQDHLNILLSAYETAQSIYETLANKNIAEGDDGYDEYLVSFAAAEEYLAYTKSAYEAVLNDANEVMRIATEAYEAVQKIDAYKSFMATVADVQTRAEEDDSLIYVIEKLTARINLFDYVEEEEEEIIEEDDEIPYTKYLSNDNNIVLVTYSDGTRFLLNYCNFAVVVEVDGVSYRVEAQDYQKLKPQAESEVVNNDN